MPELQLTAVQITTEYYVHLPKDQVIAIWEHDRRFCRGARSRDSLIRKLMNLGVGNPRLFQSGDISLIQFELTDQVDTKEIHDQIKEIISSHSLIAMNSLQKKA